MAFDDATFNKFAYARQGSSRGRFTADASTINDSFGGQNLGIGHFFHNAGAFLDDAPSTCITDGIADLDRRGDGRGGHLFTSRKALDEATIERIRTTSLNGGEARHRANQRKLICLTEGFADGRGVAQIACRKNQPIGSLPTKLLQDFKANGFLTLDTKWVQRVEQVDTKFITDLLNETHGIIEIASYLNGGRSIG